MLESLLSLVPDYGRLDSLFSKYSTNKTSRPDILENEFKKLKIFGDNPETLVCFLPWRTSLKEAINYEMFPLNKNLIVYQMPTNIVSSDPLKSKQLMYKIFSDLVDENLEKIQVLSYSVGNYVGFNIANNLDNVEKFISIVPGTTMGTGIYEGIATQHVKELSQSLGYMNSKDYDDVIADTNAIHNTKNLPKDIEIHIATHDLFIPTKYGEQIVKTIEKTHKPKIITYENCGHVSTICQFGKINKI